MEKDALDIAMMDTYITATLVGVAIGGKPSTLSKLDYIY